MNGEVGWGLDPVLVEIGGLRVWYYGLAYAMGLVAIYAWVSLQRERLGYGARDVVEFALFFGGGVIVGGRLFDVVLYEWFYYGEHPRQIPALWGGGMATHGVILGAVLATLAFCRLRGKSVLEIADAVVVPGTVLMALGRVGNHINGEVYGSISAVPWAMEFPYAEGCRHPVALYDGLKNLLILPFLLLVRSRYLREGQTQPRGLLLGIFVFLYGFLRFVVDLFRDYDSYWLGVGRGQYFNALTAAIGLAVVAVVLLHARKEARSDARRPRVRGEGVWPRGILVAEHVAFATLVVLCLTIPSGWTQEVLEDFAGRKEETTTRAPGCGGWNARGRARGHSPGASPGGAATTRQARRRTRPPSHQPWRRPSTRWCRRPASSDRNPACRNRATRRLRPRPGDRRSTGRARGGVRRRRPA
jgi:phosphatidylglycerol---prolipoprotein diacylglyceryl transferase